MSTTAITTNSLTQSPDLLAARYDTLAFRYNLASKVSLVALTAIAAVATTILLLGVTLTGAAPFLFLGSILSTYFLLNGSVNFASWSLDYSKKAEQEKSVAVALNEFKGFDETFIQEIYGKCSVDPDKAAQSYSLEEQHILMARLAFWTKHAWESYTKANQHLDRNWENSELTKVDSSDLTQEEKRQHLLNVRNTGYRIMETEALPAMLQSALILQALTHANQPPTLDAVGTTHIQPMIQRLMEYQYGDDGDDVYMTFRTTEENQAPRPPLTTREIMHLFTSNSGVKALQRRMFE